jgi:hypothetical protein
MFDAVIVVCVMGLNPHCMAFKDTRPTEKTEAACNVRAREMADQFKGYIDVEFPGREYEIRMICKDSDPEA